MKLRRKKALTPRMANKEGRATMSEAEVFGFTARRNPSAGIRAAATMSGVVCPCHIAKR